MAPPTLNLTSHGSTPLHAPFRVLWAPASTGFQRRWCTLIKRKFLIKILNFTHVVCKNGSLSACSCECIYIRLLLLKKSTICDVNDERTTIDAFYQIALSTCDSGVLEHLAEVKHCLEETKIGKTIESLVRIGNTGWPNFDLMYIIMIL